MTKVLATGYLRHDSTTVMARHIITPSQREEWSSSFRHLWWEFTLLDTPWKRLKAHALIWFVR